MDYELYHAGVKGMKWGVRKARPQATSVGRNSARSANSQADPKQKAAADAQRKARIKKGIAIGAAVAGTALAAYGAYKIAKFVKQKNVRMGNKKVSELLNGLDDLGTKHSKTLTKDPPGLKRVDEYMTRPSTKKHIVAGTDFSRFVVEDGRTAPYLKFDTSTFTYRPVDSVTSHVKNYKK